MSPAEKLALLSSEDRGVALKDITEAELEALVWDWSFWARPKQLEPDGTDWVTWLVLAGRGFGKTRTGAEWVRKHVCGSTPLGRGLYGNIALIAETAADAREVMVGDGRREGEGGGILQIHSKDYRPDYEPSKRRLTWPNGAIATLYNAVEPDQLRGPQHDAAWCDELAKWRYAEDTWDNLQFGLRIGTRPRQIITTTPRPIALLRKIIKDATTVMTIGSTMENAANLAPSFLGKIVDKYQGTRLGRQELNAEILDDAPGALWSRDLLEANRIKDFKSMSKVEIGRHMKRIVVSLDPAASSTEEASEMGIVVAGLGKNDHGYILEDLSDRLSPDKAARRAIFAYDEWGADRIVGEVNNGGEWIGQTISVTAKMMHQENLRASGHISYKAVHASRGKIARAEPVAALDEQHRVHHVGAFAEMEDQLCTYEAASGLPSPDRLDARVWAITELMLEQQNESRTERFVV